MPFFFIVCLLLDWSGCPVSVFLLWNDDKSISLIFIHPLTHSDVEWMSGYIWMHFYWMFKMLFFYWEIIFKFVSMTLLLLLLLLRIALRESKRAWESCSVWLKICECAWHRPLICGWCTAVWDCLDHCGQSTLANTMNRLFSRYL